MTLCFAPVRSRLWVGGSLVLLLLGGCASLPEASAPVSVMPVPAQWTHATAAPASGGAALDPRWWAQFGDPQLSALVEQALQANPSVRSAVAALHQARALLRVQEAALQPSVTATGSAQRSRASGVSSNVFAAGLDAQWELDLFGRLGAAAQASAADVRVAQASWGDVQVSLAGEVALAYLEVRGLQMRLEIARSNRQSQAQTLEIARWRVQAGLATSLVQEQARAAVEQTAAQEAVLEVSLAQARHALAVLTGQAPTALDALLAAQRAVPVPAAVVAQDIPANTLRQRADVRAAEARVTAAMARVAQADAARMPSLSLSGSVGLKALTVGALTGAGAGVGALLAGVSIPLLDGGAAKAQWQAQSAAAQQARAAYETAVLAALKDVEDALVALEGDVKRLEHWQAAEQAASLAAQWAQQQYTSGLIDFASVLETQRTQLSTQDNLAIAQAAVAQDHVRLFKALGGGWSVAQAQQGAVPMGNTE